MKLSLDLTAVKPEGASYLVIPAGMYNLKLESIDDKESRSNSNNRYLLFTWQIAEGTFKGMVIYDYINYQNLNPVAQEIGRARLARLISLADQSLINPDTSKLLYLTYRACIGLTEEQDTSGNPALKNKIKYFEECLLSTNKNISSKSSVELPSWA